MLKPSLLLSSASLALLALSLSACTYEDWDNSTPKDEVPGGWDDIRYHQAARYDSSTPPPLAQATPTNPIPAYDRPQP